MDSIRKRLLIALISLLAIATGAAHAQSGDRDGDGRADILWRNMATGQNWMYMMDGATIMSSVGINTVAGPDWQVAGNGDYDGDGRADILWRNSATGQNWMYLMNGAAIESSVGINTVAATEWEIVGSGDFNGDLRADILWRNSVTGQNWMYLMNGGAITSSGGINTVAGADWKIVGTGDFNGDTMADILWRNSVTGQNWMYLMDGANIMSSASVNTVANTTWKVVSTGDHNGDTRADILWRNSVTGQNWLYLMDGASISGSVGVNTVPGPDWQVVGNGDYNGDTRADILWRNGATGQNWMYLMDGATISGSAGVNTVADTNWQIVDNPNPPEGGGGVDPGPTLDARLQWRVKLPGRFSNVRPAVGPDGSVYAVDVSDNLVAVAPNGAVRWTASQAGSMGVDVGPDGTIYTGNENWIKAYNPNGTLKWTFTQSPRAHVFHDVAVGPDGHVYGLASSGMGVFSLDDTASGPVLRWANPEPFVRLFVDYTELAFGPDSSGGDQQLYFHVNDHTRAIRLSDGASVFELFGQNQSPKVSPFDGTWHVGDAAYTPDGANVWTFDFGTFATAREPALGQSGRHYAVSQGTILYAIQPGGAGQYSTLLEEAVGLPDVDPAESMLLMPTSSSVTHPSGIKAVRTSNGSPLWRMEIPPDANGLDQNVDSAMAFSADGTIAYLMSTASSGNLSPAAHLNAIAIDPTIPSASTQLRSTNIEMSTKAKGQSIDFTGVVTVLDENRNAVSGAAVHAIWTLPDNSTVSAVVNTNNSGDAKFTVTGDGGLYWLDVTDIVKTDYVFDPDHSILNQGIAGF